MKLAFGALVLCACLGGASALKRWSGEMTRQVFYDTECTVRRELQGKVGKKTEGPLRTVTKVFQVAVDPMCACYHQKDGPNYMQCNFETGYTYFEKCSKNCDRCDEYQGEYLYEPGTSYRQKVGVCDHYKAAYNKVAIHSIGMMVRNATNRRDFNAVIDAQQAAVLADLGPKYSWFCSKPGDRRSGYTKENCDRPCSSERGTNRKVRCCPDGSEECVRGDKVANKVCATGSPSHKFKPKPTCRKNDLSRFANQVGISTTQPRS